MVAKFFTGLPLDGPGPECVQGYGDHLLTELEDKQNLLPNPPGIIRTGQGGLPAHGAVRFRDADPVRGLVAPPVSACAENPLAGFLPAQMTL